MSRVIPTSGATLHPTHIPPPVRRKSVTPASSGISPAAAGFRTVLKTQSEPAEVTPQPTSRAIGSVNPWFRGPMVSLPAATASPAVPPAQSLFGLAAAQLAERQRQDSEAHTVSILQAAVGSGSPYLEEAQRTGDGPAGPTIYNPTYFATNSVATALASCLGGVVFNEPIVDGAGGPVSFPGANYIRFPNGAVVNAGQLALWATNGHIDVIKQAINSAPQLQENMNS